MTPSTQQHEQIARDAAALVVTVLEYLQPGATPTSQEARRRELEDVVSDLRPQLDTAGFLEVWKGDDGELMELWPADL